MNEPFVRKLSDAGGTGAGDGERRRNIHLPVQLCVRACVCGRLSAAVSKYTCVSRWVRVERATARHRGERKREGGRGGDHTYVQFSG